MRYRISFFNPRAYFRSSVITDAQSKSTCIEFKKCRNVTNINRKRAPEAGSGDCIIGLVAGGWIILISHNNTLIKYIDHHFQLQSSVNKLILAKLIWINTGKSLKFYQTYYRWAIIVIVIWGLFKSWESIVNFEKAAH